MNRIKFVGFARPAEFLRHRLASQGLRAPGGGGKYGPGSRPGGGPRRDEAGLAMCLRNPSSPLGPQYQKPDEWASDACPTMDSGIFAAAPGVVMLPLTWPSASYSPPSWISKSSRVRPPSLSTLPPYGSLARFTQVPVLSLTQ